jgi:excisionase family DNA binding protein
VTAHVGEPSFNSPGERGIYYEQLQVLKKDGGRSMKPHSESEILTVEKFTVIDNGFWDIEDLSKYLKVKIKTLYAMLPDIPHYRIGKLIRFKKAEIDAWLESKRENVQDIKIQTKNKRKTSDLANNHIDKLIRKTIDQTKQEDYNSYHGKSDRIEGPRKEINNGSI